MYNDRCGKINGYSRVSRVLLTKVLVVAYNIVDIDKHNGEVHFAWLAFVDVLVNLVIRMLFAFGWMGLLDVRLP